VAHEFQFSDCAAPLRHVVLGLPLRPLSLGHRIIFLRQRNPLIWAAEADFNLLPFEQQIAWLIESVTVCNQTYADRIRLENSPSWWMLFQRRRDSKRWARIKQRERKQWEKTNFNAVQKDLTAYWMFEIAAFRNYLNFSRVITEVKSRRDPFPFLPCAAMPDAQGRSMGGPYDATLVQFLVKSRLCQDEAAAMEYPFALAEMHYLTHLEREGCLRIMNSAETQFEDEVADYDLKAARAAGFDTVAEHVESITANARKAKAEREKSKATETAGLATAVPEELKGKS